VEHLIEGENKDSKYVVGESKDQGKYMARLIELVQNFDDQLAAITLKVTKSKAS